MRSGQFADSSARHRWRGAGLTILEILVVVMIIAVLFGITVGVVARVRASARSAQCITSLRSLAAAFLQYAHDSANRFPDPARANRSWEQMLLKYHRGSYACPADDELAPAVGSSYDWRDTGRPSTSLAGRSIEEITRADAVLVFEALPGWHAKRKINVGRVDGSAADIDDEACFRDLARAVTNLTDPPGLATSRRR